MADSQLNTQSFGNGRFQVIEMIGEGGMAVVYLVEDTRLGVRRALKRLKPNMLQSAEVRARFLAEARIMARIENPGIVRICDYGEENDLVWIVMELVGGGSLAKRLDRKRLSPRQAVDVCVAILSALAIAHSHNIVHRDIKPHNVLLTSEGGVKVTDFGIARSMSDDSLTKTRAIIGTWGFMAPEQKANAKTVDARADLYSTAAVLYCCLTDVGLPDLFAAEMDPKILEGIPEPLAAVIKKATRYNRDDRYGSAKEMIEALLAVRPQLPEIPEDDLSLVLPPETEEEAGSPIEEIGSAPTAVPDFTRVVSGEVETKRRETVLPDNWVRPKRSRIWFLVLVVAVVLSVAGVTWWFVRLKEESATISVVQPVIEAATPEVQTSVPVKPIVVVAVPELATKVVEPVAASQPEKRRVATEIRAKPGPQPTAQQDQQDPGPRVEAVVTPTLQHRVVTEWPLGQAFLVEARATSGQYRLRVFFRSKGTPSYKAYNMTEKGGVWRVTIRLDGQTSGFEYYILAEPQEDDLPKLTSGSGFQPHLVQIK